MDKKHRVQTQLKMISDLGHRIDPMTTILDFGCGNGDVVMEFRNNGCQAFGCDFQFKDGEYAQQLQHDGIILRIFESPYRLPFPDNTFDVVLSDQVFEHVRDYPTTIAEISRVLKPGGIGLHFFPSRHSLIEPHVFVPWAAVIQQHWWLFVWALFGIRTSLQRGMSPKEVARQNYNYLHDKTHYLNKSDIIHYFSMKSSSVTFCESVFLKYSRRAKLLHYLSKISKYVPMAYSTFRMRILLTVNYSKSS